MNNNYQNIPYTGNNPNFIPSQGTQPPYTNFPNTNPDYNSYIDEKYQYAYNILNNNPAQIASFYMSYPDSVEWRDRIFTGRVIHASREYTLLRNDETREWYVLPSIYLNYVIYDEEVNLT